LALCRTNGAVRIGNALASITTFRSTASAIVEVAYNDSQRRAGDNAATITTLVNALKDALTALSAFGTKLDVLRPTAILGVFTILFGIMSLICAFKSE